MHATLKTANVRHIDSDGPPQYPDLRKHLRLDLADLIVHRSDALEPADRALIRAVYDQGHHVTTLGRLLGVQHDLRPLRRRIRALTLRVLSKEFAFVLAHRDSWPTPRRRVATAYFLHGCSMRQVAQGCGLSTYAVRLHRIAVEELVRNAPRTPREARP